MVFYTLGTGHYLSSRGGGRIFVATTEHLRFPPLQCGFDSPTLTVEDFMILPLLSQSPQRASVAICKQVTSILILTSHEPWTTASHIWSSDMNWIVSESIVWRDYGEGLLFSSKLLKTNSLSLSSFSLSNSSSFLIRLWFSVTFFYGTRRFVCVHRLFDVSVIMTSNSFLLGKLPTNSC